MLAFGRRVEVSAGNKTINYPDLLLEFNLEFDTSSEANVGSIKVFNLSATTIEALEPNEEITIKAGYQEDLGVIFVGVIVSTSTKWQGADKETEIILGDHSDKWLKTTVNQTWEVDSSASQIVQDVANILPLEVGQIEISKDKKYPKGKNFSCTCKEALEELARDLALKLHIVKGKIYFRAEEEGTKEVVVLNKDSGLIASPQLLTGQQKKEAKSYKVQSLLNYKIESDGVIKIESKTITGLYRVTKAKHLLSGDDFLTEVEVVKYES